MLLKIKEEDYMVDSINGNVAISNVQGRPYQESKGECIPTNSKELEIFKRFDKNQDGILDKNEMSKMELRCLGPALKVKDTEFYPGLQLSEITNHEDRGSFVKYDKNDDEELSVEEMKEALKNDIDNKIKEIEKEKNEGRELTKPLNCFVDICKGIALGVPVGAGVGYAMGNLPGLTIGICCGVGGGTSGGILEYDNKRTCRSEAQQEFMEYLESLPKTENTEEYIKNELTKKYKFLKQK